jgi:hypothetical protein
MKLSWLKPKYWPIIQVYRDFENFNDWKKTIKREERNPKSKFSMWKLQRTKLYDIFITISLEESDAPLPENVKRTKVLESLNSLHRYLDEELGFAECLAPEFNQIVDDKGNPTLSYFIVYRFIFNKFSLKWLFEFLIIIGVLTFIIIKFHLISLIINGIGL